MEFKTEKEKALELMREDPVRALSFCKKWRDLGKRRDEIVRGAECVSNPVFYSALGFDPDECVRKAIVHLREHLGLK